MQRHEILQSFLGLFDAPAYLEIGVNEGHTFEKIKADVKVAVDPDFLFDVGKARERDPKAEFNAITSDAFFEKSLAKGRLFDVIFIDGLHTFDQVLKDILNSISSLSEGGIIVVDDVIPSDYAASLGDIPTMAEVRRLTGSPTFDWMGDVFKSVFFVESFLPAFHYATIVENHGQMVLWRSTKARVSKESMSLDAVLKAEYRDVILKKDHFQEAAFSDILARVSAERAVLSKKMQEAVRKILISRSAGDYVHYLDREGIARQALPLGVPEYALQQFVYMLNSQPS